MRSFWKCLSIIYHTNFTELLFLGEPTECLKKLLYSTRTSCDSIPVYAIPDGAHVPLDPRRMAEPALHSLKRQPT